MPGEIHERTRFSYCAQAESQVNGWPTPTATQHGHGNRDEKNAELYYPGLSRKTYGLVELAASESRIDRGPLPIV